MRSPLVLLLAPVLSFQLSAHVSRTAGHVCRSAVRAAVTELSSQAEFDKALSDTSDGIALVCFTTAAGLRIDRGFQTLSDSYEDYSFFKVVGDKSDETKTLLDNLFVPLGMQTVYLYKKGARRDVKRGDELDSVKLIAAIEDLRWEDGGGDDETRKPKKGDDGRIYG